MVRDKRELTLLVGVGFEKCGTSTVAHTLEHDMRFCVYPNKEAYFFNRRPTAKLDEYLDKFSIQASSRFLVDVTPDYIRSEDALRRIRLADMKKKAFVCLRDPVRRAYSHYLHLIYNHHAHYDPTNRTYAGTELYAYPFQLSFREMLEQDRNMTGSTYAQAVSKFYAIFEEADREVFLLERDFEPKRFSNKMGKLIGMDFQCNTIRSFGSKGLLPTVISPNEDLTIADGSGTAKLSKGNVYIFLSDAHGIACWENVPRAGIERICEASRKWSAYVSSTEVAEIRQQYFSEDIDALEGLLGTKLPEWRVNLPLKAGTWLGAGQVKFHRWGVYAAETIFGIKIDAKVLPPPDMTEAHRLTGFVDSSQPSQVLGWVCDEAHPSRRLTVSVKLNGSVVATTTADGYRSDLVTSIRDGRHAFGVSLDLDPNVSNAAVTCVVEDLNFSIPGIRSTTVADARRLAS